MVCNLTLHIFWAILTYLKYVWSLRNMPYASSRLCTTGSTMWKQNANGLVCFVIFGTVSFEISSRWNSHIHFSGHVYRTGRAYSQHHLLPEFAHTHTNTHAHKHCQHSLKTYFKIKIHGNDAPYVYVHLCAFALEPTHLFALVCMLYLHANVHCVRFVSCVCELSSPAWTNKEVEEEVLVQAAKHG